MTLGEQRRKALELLAPPPSLRYECVRDIEYALDWVSGPARIARSKAAGVVIGLSKFAAGTDLGSYWLPFGECRLRALGNMFPMSDNTSPE